MRRILRARSSVVPQESFAPTEDEAVGSRIGFLHLPGEIRNQIYSHVIYPKLESVTVISCFAPGELGGSVLHLPLFRVCRQVRSETLSFLCASKTIKILGVETANAFFDVVGAASRDLKRIALVQHVWEIKTLKIDSIDKFLIVIGEANTLQKFHLHGIRQLPRTFDQKEPHQKLVARVMELEPTRNIEVKVTGQI